MTTLTNNPSFINLDQSQSNANYSLANASKASLETTKSFTPPPVPPPHREGLQHFIPHSPPLPATAITATAATQCTVFEEDADYLPSSSLEMATLAGKRRLERLNSVNREFPSFTADNISRLREESKASKDSHQRLFFSRYLLEATKYLRTNPQDLKRTEELKNNMEEEAFKLLKKLASHKVGCADAQFFLADCYGNGLHGLKLDLDKAFTLYVQGSKLNHPECAYRTAACYELGLGTKKNYKHAMQFYRKAANLGDASAMYKLGMIILSGSIGQQKNPREALSWFLRAAQIADEKHPHALHELGLLYENLSNRIPSVIPDLDYARELFSQAALLGYAPSQFKLGWAYENGQLNCPTDPRRSIAWYSRAAEQNYADAELALSGWYFTGAGDILPQDDATAYLWAKKAAEKELGKAEYAIGYFTEMGFGVPMNGKEAKFWYMKAASHGDQKAIHRLQVLEKMSQSIVKRRPTRNKNGKPDAKNSDCILM
ncbi:hypothetical protein G6F37_005561 [Rhizopus arrhizus]|nr:hypothetical protein G6F38_011144 [Rhizopus arrhizus]KAG1158696.1 hypothetical protein G6F37_005561 [Rhizopus arrhizus]